MTVRNAEAVWEGSLREGKGVMKFGSGAFEGAFSYASRFEEGPGTNPEELLGAAHAGCFSMSLSSQLTKAGFTPSRIHTTAAVHLEMVDGARRITKIHLTCEADVPGIDAAAFAEKVEAAKTGCPVSKALAGVDISVEARLAR